MYFRRLFPPWYPNSRRASQRPSVRFLMEPSPCPRLLIVRPPGRGNIQRIPRPPHRGSHNSLSSYLPLRVPLVPGRPHLSPLIPLLSALIGKDRHLQVLRFGNVHLRAYHVAAYPAVSIPHPLRGNHRVCREGDAAPKVPSRVVTRIPNTGGTLPVRTKATAWYSCQPYSLPNSSARPCRRSRTPPRPTGTHCTHSPWAGG